MEVISAVPQVTFLGPLLFLMFINDLPDTVTSNTRLFADDCIIYRTVKSIQDCLQLQEDLRELATWEEIWGKLFHPNKCNVLRITRARSPVLFVSRLKNQTLEAVTQSKYLGISLNLSWNRHIDRIVKKGNSMIGFLQRNLRVSIRDTNASAYPTLVWPNIEYCASVWNPYTDQGKRKIEMVQRCSARYVTNR